MKNKPAFPRPHSTEEDYDGNKAEHHDQYGMTMLEYYAGQALLGYMSVAQGSIDTVRIFHIAEDMCKEAEKRK